VKFNTSFQKIIDIKEYETQQQTLEFSLVKSKQTELETKLHELEQKKEDSIEKHQLMKKMTVLDMIEFQQGIDHLDKQIIMIQSELIQVVQIVEKEHELLLEKVKETKKWNRLKEKSLTALQEEKNRKEQLFLDEIATLHYAR
jgi:flagellar protein FliJ